MFLIIIIKSKFTNKIIIKTFDSITKLICLIIDFLRERFLFRLLIHIIKILKISKYTLILILLWLLKISKNWILTLFNYSFFFFINYCFIFTINSLRCFGDSFTYHDGLVVGIIFACAAWWCTCGLKGAEKFILVILVIIIIWICVITHF